MPFLMFILPNYVNACGCTGVQIQFQNATISTISGQVKMDFVLNSADSFYIDSFQSIIPDSLHLDSIS